MGVARAIKTSVRMCLTASARLTLKLRSSFRSMSYVVPSVTVERVGVHLSVTTGVPQTTGTGSAREKGGGLWEVINKDKFSVDKKNLLDVTFVLFIPLLLVAQHVSGNHVPIIRS